MRHLVLVLVLAGCVDDQVVDEAALVFRPVGMVIHGDLTIRGEADLRRLAKVVEVTGKLVVDDAALTTLSLPRLRRVGTFKCDDYDGTAPCNLTRLSLPALERADTFLITANQLASLSLPSFASGTMVSFTNVHEVSAPKLASCMWLYLEYAQDRPSGALSFPALQSCVVNGEGISESIDLSRYRGPNLELEFTHLDSLALPAMASGSIEIEDGEVGALALPAYSHGALMITDARLPALDLTAMESGEVCIQNSHAISSVTFSPTASFDQLSLVNNYRLDACPLWHALGEPPGEIFGNADGTCD